MVISSSPVQKRVFSWLVLSVVRLFPEVGPKTSTLETKIVCRPYLASFPGSPERKMYMYGGPGILSHVIMT